ncbi:hypothetical protein F5887DRAFT_977118 [Amanita rubescens]|nr:hypothetical protein F5887DRAFT_977118 [Amanita rubescens]
MDDKRASTLKALESFIRNQRLLLEQTQEDIAKLRKLQSYTLATPNADSGDILRQLDEIGEIKDPLHYRLVIPNEIDWDVFNGCDPAPFHTLTLSMQEKHALSTKPSLTQTSPLSDLQKIVKDSKKTIIDPVLERCAAYTAQLSLEDDNDESDAGGDKHHKEYWRIEMERERERHKIRELKKRKLHGGLSLPGMGGAGVFVRKDVEDESAVVDVTVAADGDEELELFVETENIQLDADHDPPPLNGHGRPPLMDTDVMQAKSRPARTHKATAKRQQWQDEENSSSSKKRKRQAGSSSRSAPMSTPRPAKAVPLPTPVQDPGSPMNVDEDEDENETENEPFIPTTNGKSKSARGRAASSSSNPQAQPTKPNKPKSETYKQAWSESEQNLLEQLLEKIPDGEKNRWQKISRAMNGRRTPRQVASRVQKYFEKLKKYGIDIGKGSWSRGAG